MPKLPNEDGKENRSYQQAHDRPRVVGNLELLLSNSIAMQPGPETPLVKRTSFEPWRQVGKMPLPQAIMPRELVPHRVVIAGEMITRVRCATNNRFSRASAALALLLSTTSQPLQAKPAQIVSFTSGGKTLHGLLYKPAGPGPFRTVLYNHGSAPGLLNNQAFARLGLLFTSHDWAFFAPYRRGQGLSAHAGPYIGKEISSAYARGGLPLAAATMVRLLDTQQLQDQMAALAWLKRQPFARGEPIAVMGNSFGGVETVLGADNARYCAAVDAAGGAESWNKAPALRTLMINAVRHARMPILFIQAQNDYTVAPSKTLYKVMRDAGKKAAIRLFPAYGTSAADGHSFAWKGGSIWASTVFPFLDNYCSR